MEEAYKMCNYMKNLPK
jgi:hypothetical protein